MSEHEQDRWWNAVTIDEMRGSADLIQRFLSLEDAPSQASGDHLARAVALQVLLVDDQAIERIVRSATARTDELLAAINEGNVPLTGPGSKLEGWLDRRLALATALNASLAYLPQGMREPNRAWIDELQAESIQLIQARTIAVVRANPPAPITLQRRRDPSER